MEEIVKRLLENHRILEMATVGNFVIKQGNKPISGEYKVFTTSDSGRPQVHVHIKTKTGDVHSCIKLDKPEYFSHGPAKDKLSAVEIEHLIKFMNSPSSQRIFSVDGVEYKLRTQWDYTIATWNVENDNPKIPISKDDEGFIIVPKMPDYSKLK